MADTLYFWKKCRNGIIHHNFACDKTHLFLREMCNYM